MSCEIVSYAILNINPCISLIFTFLVQTRVSSVGLGPTRDSSMNPLFRPWSQGGGSFVQTRDRSLGPLFRLRTGAWGLYSDYGQELGAFVQTKDWSLGPLFRPGTGAWGHSSD